MAIIMCLAGVLVFVVYQQEQIIEKQGRYITGLNERLVESNKAYGDLNWVLQKREHDIWHYSEQIKWLYAENQRMHSELINSALYEIDSEIGEFEGEGWVIRSYSYRKVEPEPVIKYVEVPVEVIKEVEVITYRNIYARNWESVEQFKEWYGAQHFTVLMDSPYYEVDCDDYSEWVQRKALQQGYSVSEAIAKNKLYAGVRVTKISGLHAGNLVMIDGVYYWVEPQPDMFYIKRLFDRD